MSHWWTSLTDLTSMTSVTVYVVVFTLVFVESGLLVGFFLPGDSVLFAAGLLSAQPQHDISLTLMTVGVAVAAVAGDAVGYWSGRRFGRPWLLRRAGRAARHVERAERFYDRWGPLAVVVARFIPWVRTFTPIVAGIGRMPYPRFLAANVTGALLWGSGLVLLGRAAYGNPAVKWAAYAIAITAIALSFLVPLFGWLFKRRPRTVEPDSDPSGGSESGSSRDAPSAEANRNPERPAPEPEARPAPEPEAPRRSSPRS